jgi:hypothetical protein
MVFMDNLEMADFTKTYVRVTSNEMKRYFYSHCGEVACRTADMKSGLVGPVLKLFPGCPLMLTDVCNGQAKGSRLRLQRVIVKHGELSGFLAELKCALFMLHKSWLSLYVMFR